ncbi:arginase family protein [Larkinella ripae]
MKTVYQRIEAPCILGLKPSGVELLPYALRQYGFLKETAPALSVPIDVTAFSDQRRSNHEVLNTDALAAYSARLAETVQQTLKRSRFPVVLGGDCSILLGCLLALKQRGTFGLAHIDAHADFYQPEAEPTGEAASMDLALVTGHGPEQLTNLQNQKPYVREEHVVQLARRDADEAERAGSQRIEESAIHCFDLALIRKTGIQAVLTQATAALTAQHLDGYWIHFDVDVLADEIMPAVDYRIPGGLSFAEAAAVLRHFVQAPGATGLSITIFNPKLDPDGTLTQQLVNCLHQGLGYVENR